MSGNIMYRNEEAFGDGYRKAEDVVAHEVFELSNFDVLHYVFRHYVLPRELRRKWRGYYRELVANGYVDDMSDDELVAEVRELLDVVGESVGVNISYVLWLAEKESVVECYDGTEDNIDAYDTSGGVILSDLGFDGKLFGFSKNPEPIDI